MTDKAAPVSKGRTHLFQLLAFILVVAAVEFGSMVMLRTAFVEYIAPLRNEPLPEELGRQIPAKPHYLGFEAIHPYLGFVLDASRRPASRIHNLEASEYGFGLSYQNIFQQPAEDQLVVAILGGSMAAHLSLDDTLPLHNELLGIDRFAGRKVVMTNLGAGGYKQPQQLMALNYFLALGAHFDVVINLDGFNDLALAADLSEQGLHPSYPRSWHLRVEELDPTVRSLAGEITYLRRLEDERAENRRHSPWRASQVATLLWRIAERRLSARIAHVVFELDSAQPDVGALTFQARGPKREDSSRAELLQDLAALWRRSSQQMHSLCTGLGIEYYHFLQPNQYDPGSKPLSVEERRKFFRENHPYRSAVTEGYPLLRAQGAELRRSGVGFHDASRLFAEVEDTLYRDDCCHVNVAGNRLLAHRIASAVGQSRP